MSLSSGPCSLDVFLLTASAADRNGHCVLSYWGISSQGPVLVEFTSHKPLFFVPRHAVLPHGAEAQRRQLELCDFQGTPVDALYFPTLTARRRARSFPGETCEADIRPEDRFLMERFITGSLRAEGNCVHEGLLIHFKNPKITPSEWRPQLCTLSLDIETGTDGSLYSLAMDIHGPRGRVQQAAVRDEDAPDMHVSPDPKRRFRRLRSEKALLRFLIEVIVHFDPDVIIGWHVTGFDLDFLERKSKETGLPLRIGRSHQALRLVRKQGRNTIAELDGRIVVDGPSTLRGAFFRFPDWRLETVAMGLLNRGKDISAQGRDKTGEIDRRFREDKDALLRYNMEDAELVTDIFRETDVLEQLVTRSLITGLPPDQVHRSVAAFDRFFLPRLHRKGRVAPNQNDVKAPDGAPGGMVFSQGAGLFTDVAVLDFKSLYPTIIRTFHIDPCSLLSSSEDPLETPAEINFSRSTHILPEYIEQLMQRRLKAVRDGDKQLSQAVKILMNSMYGVMGAAGSRFCDSRLPAAITGIGRWVLERTSAYLKDLGYQVLYGDTDSVFVRFKTAETASVNESGKGLAAKVSQYFQDMIQERYNVPSFLELEFEKHYLKLFLPAMRQSSQAALKRYAGLLPDQTVEIKGMEFVRSDSTGLARDFQYELFRRYFAGDDLKSWIRETIKELKSGKMDDKLVYRRRLSRPLDQYKSHPPHVQAIKMLDPDGKRGLKRVEYVITARGPVPLELNPSEIDYSHYIEKQMKPLADDVLSMENQSFDSIVGGQQLTLF